MTSAIAKRTRCVCAAGELLRALVGDVARCRSSVDHLVDLERRRVERRRSSRSARARRGRGSARRSGASRRPRRRATACLRRRAEDVTVPSSGPSRPSSMSIVVDLPAPFGPSSATVSPRRESRRRCPRTASIVPLGVRVRTSLRGRSRARCRRPVRRRRLDSRPVALLELLAAAAPARVVAAELLVGRRRAPSAPRRRPDRASLPPPAAAIAWAPAAVSCS